MNTREREVMGLSRHSRAMLLNVLWHHQGGSSAVGQPIRALLGIGEHDELTAEQVAEAKWIDALLAEGSASSEGAEAVAPVAWMTPGNNFLLSDHAKRHGVPPAYGMKPSDASIPLYTHPQHTQGEMKRWCANMAEHESNAGDPDATILPQQGEHEQRSCEGSERRPIADEAVEPPYFVEVDKNGCAACGHERSWTVVGPGDVAEGQSWLDEEEADRVCERMNAAYYAGRESALPRGLPAGSDAQLKVIDEVIRLLESPAVMPSPLGGINYAPEHYFCLLHDFKRVRTELATAEQPYCGQDARDAERYRALFELPRFEEFIINFAGPRGAVAYAKKEDVDTTIDGYIASAKFRGEL